MYIENFWKSRKTKQFEAGTDDYDDDDDASAL